MSAELEENTRQRRWPLALAAVLGLQALAIGAYLLVERAREEPRPLSPPPLTLVEGTLPPLVLERPGASLALPADDSDELMLLHVWATWCKPCREELPALLALDGKLPARLLTVSTDERWEVIAHFFEGKVPPSIWRVALGEDHLPVNALPTTLIVRGRSIVGRLEGAQEWTHASALALLERARAGASAASPLE